MESPDARTQQLKRSFDQAAKLTVGLEEEVMLLDPDTLELCPRAEAVLARLPDDGRFTRELPAAQVEIRTPPDQTASGAIAALAAARSELAAACGSDARPAVAGVHPFAPALGELASGPRYDRIRHYYGWAIQRQLVMSLQVHVAVGGADSTLAVYNALRCYLPEIAALAANAPVYEGVDTGLASVRPLICTSLPRQGVPPSLSSWECFASELAWGARSEGFPDPSAWWWELRPNLKFGTLEVRVPDAQTLLSDAGGVVAFVHALVAMLLDACEAGERLLSAPTWRIEENRWAALRYGIEGQFVDLRSGRQVPIRDRLLDLIDQVTPSAQRLGAAGLLASARRLAEANGAIRQRDRFHAAGARGLADWLAGSFLTDSSSI